MFCDNFFHGEFGLERETLRVDSFGTLAQTPHPFCSDRFVRDFCENQLELITPVCKGTEHLMQILEDLDSEARETLKRQNEYIWLSSNPPHFYTENDIPIANYTGDEAYKHDYRVYLGNKYGKRIMLYSGIHLNFSFSDKLIEQLHNGHGDYTEFKNNLYFRLSKQAFRYSWLLVLLTAASPVCDSSLNTDNAVGTSFDGYSSLRNSEKGYWNNFIPILDYSDLESYIKSINKYIENGALYSAAELYLPVRLKPIGSNSPEKLLEKGVNHIELRMFDINPLAPLGIFKEDLDFTHYFLLYLMQLPDFEFTPKLQLEAVNNHKESARYILSDINISGISAVNAALELLNDMTTHFKECPLVLKSIDKQKDKLINNNRYCITIYEQYHSDFNRLMLETAKNPKL